MMPRFLVSNAYVDLGLVRRSPSPGLGNEVELLRKPREASFKKSVFVYSSDSIELLKIGTIRKLSVL